MFGTCWANRWTNNWILLQEWFEKFLQTFFFFSSVETNASFLQACSNWCKPKQTRACISVKKSFFNTRIFPGKHNLGIICVMFQWIQTRLTKVGEEKKNAFVDSNLHNFSPCGNSKHICSPAPFPLSWCSGSCPENLMSCQPPNSVYPGTGWTGKSPSGTEEQRDHVSVSVHLHCPPFPPCSFDFLGVKHPLECGYSGGWCVFYQGKHGFILKL